MANSLKGLCTPVQVFVVLAVISTIIYLINMFTTVHISDPVDPGDYLFKNNAVQFGYMALVLKVIFYIMFGYLLQVLCNNRLDKVAWIILFLPYVLFGFIMLYAMSMGALATVRGKTGLLAGSGFRVGGPDRGLFSDEEWDRGVEDGTSIRQAMKQRNHGSNIGVKQRTEGTDEDGNQLFTPERSTQKSKDNFKNVFTKCLGMPEQGAKTLVNKLWGSEGQAAPDNIRTLQQLKDMSSKAFNSGLILTNYEKYILSRLDAHGGGPNSNTEGESNLFNWTSAWVTANPFDYERFYLMYGPISDACDWRNVYKN